MWATGWGTTIPVRTVLCDDSMTVDTFFDVEDVVVVRAGGWSNGWWLRLEVSWDDRVGHGELVPTVDEDEQCDRSLTDWR